MDVLKGMNEALQYIEDNLDNTIDMKEIAKKAYCSEYHFKRLFSLLAGITISEYIRKRRLTAAALELKSTDIKVIDLAVKYGYQSPDAFSRAFYQFHGMTPSSAKSSVQGLTAYPRMTFQLTVQGGIEMKYRIMEKDEFKVVGVKHEVEMENETLTPTYDEMLSAISGSKMKELESLSNKEPSGVVHVTADYSESLDGKGSFNQYIGAVTTKEKGEGDAILEVPSLLWAIFEVAGEWEQVEEQWERIYTEWLPSSSYELAEGPELVASKAEKSEIWIPIKST